MSLLIYLLLFVIAVLGICGLAYHWGPDDTRTNGITAREKSAASIAIGLGIALPWVTFANQVSLWAFVGTILISLLVAARAGRRALLYGYLTSLFTFVCWFVADIALSARSHPDVGSVFALPTSALGIYSFFLAMPCSLLYTIWDRRRKHNRKNQHSASGMHINSVAAVNQAVPSPMQIGTTVPNTQHSTAQVQVSKRL